MKDPYFAGFLNIIPGLGYLYIGTRKVFAGLLLAGVVLGIIDSITDPYAAEYADMPVTIWSSLSIVIIVAAFIYDAYNLAKKQNKQTSRTN